MEYRRKKLTVEFFCNEKGIEIYGFQKRIEY